MRMLVVAEDPVPVAEPADDRRLVGDDVLFGVALAGLVAIVWLLVLLLPAAVGR